jgi:hypothetical protein
MWKLVLEAPEADKLEVVPRNAISLFLHNAFHLQTEDDILEYAHPREERVVLEDHGVFPARSADCRAVDRHGAGCSAVSTRVAESDAGFP